MNLKHLSNTQINRLYSVMREMNYLMDDVESCLDDGDVVVDWNDLFDAVSAEISERYPVTPTGKPYPVARNG